MIGTLPLRTGDHGEAVADLQRRLGAAGHVSTPDPVGRFGPATEGAVREFQERRGLRSDGVCGDETWASLVEAGHRLGDRLLSHRAPMLRGDDVAELQQLLGGLGFDAGRVDGFFGPDTAAAVVEFQRNVGLPTDGVCGPDTVGALRRFAGHTGEGSTVARLRETDALRHAPPGLLGRRIVVGEGGEAVAPADALAQQLHDDGAVVTVLHHPDDHEKAHAANAFVADLYLGLVIREQPGVTIAYYCHQDFESVGGRRLAEMVAAELPTAVTGTSAPVTLGMRLPVLRETRMPAVLIEVGPPHHVVRTMPALVSALVTAVRRWSTQPVD